MSENKDDPELRAGRQSDQRIKNVLDYLHRNLKNKIRLEDLAAIALLSPCHLLRVFKKSVGLTPKEYLLHLRIEKAKQLLMQGIPVSEIVLMTGFSDKNHLSRTFRKITGASPHTFLRKPTI